MPDSEQHWEQRLGWAVQLSRGPQHALPEPSCDHELSTIMTVWNQRHTVYKTAIDRGPERQRAKKKINKNRQI